MTLREPIYCRVADAIVDGDGPVGRVVSRVLDRWRGGEWDRKGGAG